MIDKLLVCRSYIQCYGHSLNIQAIEAGYKGIQAKSGVDATRGTQFRRLERSRTGDQVGEAQTGVKKGFQTGAQMGVRKEKGG